MCCNQPSRGEGRARRARVRNYRRRAAGRIRVDAARIVMTQRFRVPFSGSTAARATEELCARPTTRRIAGKCDAGRGSNAVSGRTWKEA